MSGAHRLARFTAIAALAGLGACATSPPPLAEPPPTPAHAPRPPQAIADGRWELIASSLIAGARLPGERRPTLEFKDGQLTAFSGCNRAAGSAMDADGRLAVGRLATTRMACPGPLMKFEQDFFRLLAAEPVLSVVGNELLLIAGEERARFQRAGVAPDGRP